MSTDYYQTLGVPRNANPDDIKRAYRKLAGQHHPDKGGDTKKFQDIQAAYATLGDAEKRAQYDNPAQNAHFDPNGGGFDFSNIFNMFGATFNPHAQHRQQHTRMSLWITLQDVARGGTRTVSMGTTHGTTNIEIEIPLGINDGDNVQYSGIGPGGTDLIVNFRVHPHPNWQRNGLHLVTEHSISIWDCLVGTETEIKDILGNYYSLTIPPLTQPGGLLRLKGKGLRSRQGATGDLLVKIQAQMPNMIDEELLAMIKKVQKK
jgi:DnaJ-class molecular chaperone